MSNLNKDDDEDDEEETHPSVDFAPSYDEERLMDPMVLERESSAIGVLDDYLPADEESKRRRRPCLGIIGILLLVICSVTLASGLYVGMTQTKCKADGKGAAEEIVVDDDKERSDDESTPTSDKIQQINSVGTIQNGIFRALENHPLPSARIDVFGDSSTTKYSSCQILRDDITNAASILVNEIIVKYSKATEISYYDLIGEEFSVPTTMDEESTSPIKDEKEDSYGTNNQVQGIDEADIVKSTADHAFAAYGDKLVVWNVTSGETCSITKVKTPLDRVASVKRLFPGVPNIRIESLLMKENRLIAIVGGYDSSSLGDRIFKTYNPSKMLVYDISTIPTDGTPLPLLTMKDLGGRYVDARLMGATGHVVSISDVDTFHHLERHFNRGQTNFEGLNRTEYITVATEYANSVILPSFVERMMKEMNETGRNCENILKLSMLRTSDEEQGVPSVESLLGGFVQITSFDILYDFKLNLENHVWTNTTGSFVPSATDATVYANDDHLVLANKGYKYSSDSQGWQPCTFVMAFVLDDNSVNGISSTELLGYVLNQYSLDIWDGHLRIASTINAKWGCVEDDIDSSTRKRTGQNQCVWKFLEDTNNFVSVYKLQEGESLSMQRVGFLGNIGEEGERIESIRFMKEKAFIVTFKRTDPFYTIDMTNHSSPEIKGELKVTGFSNYLHPYDEEGDFIIGVGQDANEEGEMTGLQISLFNATNFTETSLLHRYNVEEENSQGISSSSAAQYDPKAFRFLPISKKLIIPSRINDSNHSKSFDGFLVFDVSLDGIEYSFNVSHTDGSEMENFCWYDAYMKPRSLVHAGVLTTMKGHSILAHDLYTKIRQWKVNLDEDNKECSPLQ